MGFAAALNAMQANGKRFARKDWSGAFIVLEPIDGSKETMIFRHDAADKQKWHPSAADIRADDWQEAAP